MKTYKDNRDGTIVEITDARTKEWWAIFLDEEIENCVDDEDEERSPLLFQTKKEMLDFLRSREGMNDMESWLNLENITIVIRKIKLI